VSGSLLVRASVAVTLTGTFDRGARLRDDEGALRGVERRRTETAKKPAPFGLPSPDASRNQTPALYHGRVEVVRPVVTSTNPVEAMS